jgi:spore coat protein U-like protein
MKRLSCGTLLALMAVLFTAGRCAATTESLTVSATVNSSCAISSGGGTLSFGTYDPMVANASTELAQTSSFRMQCSSGTSAAVLLNQGLNPDAASTDAAPIRYMTNGAARLNYQLYTTAAHTAVWDNVHGGAQVGNGQAQAVTIYGVIPAGQNVPPGTYTDTVIITLSY